MDPAPSIKLVDLIAPLTREVFFREFWEQRPLVQRGSSANRFAGLFSTSVAERLISEGNVQPPKLRVTRDGVTLPAESYAAERSGQQRPLADLARLREQYQRGATILLTRLQRSWPPAARLCSHLEEELGHPITIAAFWSPPNVDGSAHQALPAHYDNEDAFVLQVSGTKRWRIYDAPFPLPLADQDHYTIGVAPGECLHDVTLEAGDVVYLPRGQFHEARTTDEHSLHLTVSIPVYRWLDALTSALQSLAADVRFRRAVPLRALDDEGLASFTDEFEQMRELALRRLSADAAVAGLRRAILERQGRTPRGPTTDPGLEVRADTVVRRSRGALGEVAEDAHGRLRFGDKTLSGPSPEPASLCFLTTRLLFRVADIPGRLDEAGKVELTRRLMDAGILEIVDGANERSVS